MENYTIDVEQVVEKGTIWNVRLRKKGFFKKLISSDWFLDDEQARTFAKTLADRLANNSNTEFLKKRKPGWTFNRPAR